MQLWRRRIRAKQAGTVVSVRTGTRTRIIVKHDDGKTGLYFVTTPTVKPGRRVRKGKALGKL